LTDELEITYLPLEGLIPYANNSRTHSEAQIAQIAASIREFGFTNPILIDQDGGIIAGHGRVLAARKLALDVVPTIMLAGLTDTQRKAYVIADNKLALNAGWDDELLALELSELGELGFDLELTGFTQEEIDALTPEQTRRLDRRGRSAGGACRAGDEAGGRLALRQAPRQVRRQLQHRGH
jgi:ParB-like chromosome segregation protein Spo0J